MSPFDICTCGDYRSDHEGRCEAMHGEPHPITGSKVVLTTAHRHGSEIEDCGDGDLFAACETAQQAQPEGQEPGPQDAPQPQHSNPQGSRGG